MWKLIFLAVLAWLVITIAKRMLRSKATGDKNSGNTSDEVNMVQCSTCKVHLPRSEAFLSDGKFYCCEAHISKK